MTFTAGQVLTAAELNDLDITSLTVDTTTLVVDATNNRVGIGTASPTDALDVDGNVDVSGTLTVDGIVTTGDEIRGGSGSASDPVFTFASDSNTGLYSYSADNLGFTTGGAAAARISSANDLYLAGDYLAFNSVSSVDDSIRHTGVDFFFRSNAIDIVEFHRHTDTRASVQVVQEVSNTADSGYLAFRFDADTDTGIYRHGTNILGVAAGGVPTIAGTSTGVAINNSTGTGTGTNCDLVTASVNGVSMLALRRDTSVAAAKSGIVDFDLSDADYLSIQPRSFVWNGQYIGPNGEFGTTNGDDVDDTMPDGSVLMRRAGFIYEEMLEVDLHLVGDHSIDWRALQAATVAKVQSLLERVATLEAA